MHFSYLNASDTPTGALSGDDPSNTATNPVLYDSANQANLPPSLVCIDAGIVIGATQSFPSNKLKYDLLGVTGPNSNSFAHYLALLVPDLAIVHPPGAIGWNHPLFPGIKPWR
jgi:hypothetical protein